MVVARPLAVVLLVVVGRPLAMVLTVALVLPVIVALVLPVVVARLVLPVIVALARCVVLAHGSRVRRGGGVREKSCRSGKESPVVSPTAGPLSSGRGAPVD
ncbi:hypothetical protein GCM10010230_11770 [Streptomyces narbonensis]|nr:hypothetical protein GCM10010230_11770 [Streptomyces narbonensis]